MDDSISIDNVLDIVKDILATVPLASQDARSDHVSVLPQNIKALDPRITVLNEKVRPLSSVVQTLSSDILPNLNASSLSPRYYGFVTGGATPAALVGDILASIFDQNAAVHLPKETLTTNVEVGALNMLVDLFNLPKDDWRVGSKDNGGATITTGATASNVLGLALGREYVLSKLAQKKTGESVSTGEIGVVEAAHRAGIRQIKIMSTMPHSSIAKAASVIGLGRASIVDISSPDDKLAIDIHKLRKLAQSAQEEEVAYILTISTGEVNTGRFATDSFATMQEIRSICDSNDIWLHVDGAFGLFGRILLDGHSDGEYAKIAGGVRGIELADSITGDCHKLLNVPYDCGVFFTRHKRLSEDVFSNGNAAYLTSGMSSSSTDYTQSPLNIGIENSRRFRGLPVFAALSVYGRKGYVDMLIRQIKLARSVAAWIYDHGEFELLPMSPSKQDAIANTYMVVLFRARQHTINANLVKQVNASGKMYLTGTQWDGKPAARIAISNWMAEESLDAPIIKEVLESVLEISQVMK